MQSVTLLDGGMGQELIRRSGQEPTPMWSAKVMLELPTLVQALHADFINAGAQLITVNAYSATPERLERDNCGELFKPLQQAACQAATSAREQTGDASVKIAGCLPPLVTSYRPELAPPRAKSIDLYSQIVEQQLDSVDLFMCETMGSVSEAHSAATAACQSGKEVWVALTLDDEQALNLRSGEPLIDAVAALEELNVSALLLNCSRPETIDAAWPTFAASTSLPVGAYANGFCAIDPLQAGGTVKNLEARRDLGPEEYAHYIMQWVDARATLVGGCCEVGPEHIAVLNTALQARGLKS